MRPTKLVQNQLQIDRQQTPKHQPLNPPNSKTANTAKAASSKPETAPH